MKIRRDSVFISGVLFTIGLLSLVPWFLKAVLAGHNRVVPQSLDPDFLAAANRFLSDLGVASLAIISIGLIVTWTGYINRVRWTWFIMFIIVWVWAFPLLVLPLFEGTLSLTWAEWLYSAIYQPGLPRVWAGSVLIFALMVIALLLPLKSFVRGGKSPEIPPSLQRIGFAATIVLVIAVGALVWIHSRVYVPAPSELNSWQRFPPPPPPPARP
jgi:hypothetical protein